ncbi:hypothetical protein FRC00_013894 [Tulasnella sp. 408]|nr:hypothetical protein FRC00_013894 [Tulasnella sp. 408]
MAPDDKSSHVTNQFFRGEDPKKIVSQHIKLLHDYNEAKDKAQIAALKGVSIKQLHEEYGLEPED